MATTKIQLGYELTQGLGAGSKPDVGCAAAEETLGEIESKIKGSHMVFITAGMGGGTGTGAAPVIAKAARNAGILTVGVVTKPFLFEGAHRMRAAEAGLKELQKHVDTLIVIPNQNLFRLADTKTTFADAFNMADNVLYSGVRGVTDLMIMPGLINLDFADVRTVMSEMGKAMMGTGEAEGENRAIAAAEAAVANPLLDEVSLKGANGVLINITGGMDMTLFEVDEAANYIREQVDKNANIIFGSTFDDRLQGRIRVSVVAIGIEGDGTPQTAGRLSRDTAKDFLSSTLPQTQLEFEEEVTESNPLPLATEEEMLVTSTATFTTEEGEVKLSFWERLGLKKAKETPKPELILTHNDQENPGPIAEEAVVDEEEDLDIPTFLRQRKPR
jgi:cell division protein FtsZ